MYIGSWKLDDKITLGVVTSSPSTGAKLAADSNPTYRVYKDLNAIPISLGTLLPLDSGNTTGLYANQLHVTTSGYNYGNSYNVYISTTVSGVSATTLRTFQVGSESIPIYLGVQSKTDIKTQIETVINAYEPIKTSVSGRLLDVSANGNAGIDWNNIDNPTTLQGLSNTTISDVSGAVGSVTGNVGGNVVGSLGSLGANAIDNNSIHANACSKLAVSGIQRGAANWENNLDNRSLGWAISKLVNKVDLNAAGNTLSIRKSNDSTALFTQAVTTSGGAAPITAVDTV